MRFSLVGKHVVEHSEEVVIVGKVADSLVEAGRQSLELVDVRKAEPFTASLVGCSTIIRPSW